METDVHTVRDIEIDPDVSANIPLSLAFEWTQADPQSVCLKDVAPANIKSMLVTLDTSQLEMSSLNSVALRNIEDMSCTFDTSHFDRSPLNAAA